MICPFLIFNPFAKAVVLCPERDHGIYEATRVNFSVGFRQRGLVAIDDSHAALAFRLRGAEVHLPGKAFILFAVTGVQRDLIRRAQSLEG